MNGPKPFFKTSKRKRWFRHWSVSAPQMTIRTQLPWPARAVFIAIVVGLGGAIALWGYDLGRGIAGFRSTTIPTQIAPYNEELDRLRAERDKHVSTANAAESQINIERSTQQQMATQIKSLETENIKLKENLAFFESLLPVTSGAQGISIRRLDAETIAPNQLRYRLLVMQGGKNAKDFVGNVQLAVTVLQGGKSAIITFPEANSSELDKFKLGFRHYQRVEGTLTLPDSALIKSVQARILDKGQTRAQQSTNL